MIVVDPSHWQAPQRPPREVHPSPVELRYDWEEEMENPITPL